MSNIINQIIGIILLGIVFLIGISIAINTFITFYNIPSGYGGLTIGEWSVLFILFTIFGGGSALATSRKN